jgi:hypothetical protein
MEPAIDVDFGLSEDFTPVGVADPGRVIDADSLR